MVSALIFAKAAHSGQKRKYTLEPYIMHPIAVSQIVASVTDDTDMIDAALLHDVVEDTDITLGDLIETGFSARVVALVDMLTNTSKSIKGANRAERKAADKARLAEVSYKAKTIKLADIIHNMNSAIKSDPGFATMLMADKSDLLPVLVGGNKELYAKAEKIIKNYYESIETKDE